MGVRREKTAHDRRRNAKALRIVKIDDLLSQHMVARIIGRSRLMRLLRAGWITPTTNSRTYRTAPIFYSARDVHAALKRLEHGEFLLPDLVETARVRDSERRHGHRSRRKANADTVMDFDSIDFAKLLWWLHYPRTKSGKRTKELGSFRAALGTSRQDTRLRFGSV